MIDLPLTQEQFNQDVANGTMNILRDDGLYRHLHFRMASGGFSWFDIVTWPGHLVITGDCETFTFNRLEDMFEFFRTRRINASYWQEKVIDGRERARSFDWDTFRAAALEQFDSDTKDLEADQRQQGRSELEDALDSEPDEYGAVDVLRNFTYCEDGEVLFRFDLSDGAPSGKVWDFHYIWCCYAIVWAIDQYDTLKVKTL